MEGTSLVALGFLASLAAGLMTAIGALPVLFTKKTNRGVRDLALGFAAGVMLAASFFSLIIPSLDASELRYGGSVVPAAIACVAILLGIGMVALLNELLPHEHFEQGREGPEAASLRRIWLFIIAITIHNLPEGLAVGVAFGAGGSEGGCRLPLVSAFRMRQKVWPLRYHCSGWDIHVGDPGRLLPSRGLSNRWEVYWVLVSSACHRHYSPGD